MNPFPDSANRVWVSAAALKSNYRLMRSVLPPATPLLAMVKADAYGHGMVAAAGAFAEAGCRHFGVAELPEAVRLREYLYAAGIDAEILVMAGLLPGQEEYFPRYGLSAAVFSLDSARLLSAAGAAAGRRVLVHIKVDCGMTRLGIMPEETLAFTEAIEQLSGIELAGIFAHFPEADSPEKPSNRQVRDNFAVASAAFTTVLSAAKGLPPRHHLANSAGILNQRMAHFDMARSGIALYGYAPDGIPAHAVAGGEALQPAMRFVSRVLQVKDVAAGCGVSYGHTFVTARPSRLAVLPVGYEDGYQRALSNKASVLIHGRRAPIVGRICMNLCLADVTEIAAVATGDEVVLLGCQGDECVSADELAALAGTISYELLCMIGNNNQREMVA
ncbi:MAG TPA: alanine racemase [Desulfobulbaceae bacterium]|nr:alanine racemase [Desulfobulbaceae bacterium]